MGSNDDITKKDAPLIDHRFNVLSYEQYLKDIKVKKFSKMSMTEVINADMMIASYGEEKYTGTCRDILATGSQAYKQLGLDKIIHVYAYTYKNFMAVANDDISDEDFYGLMKGFFDQYQLASSQSTELGGVSRFVLVFGDNMVNRAKSAFYLNRQLQNNFIIAKDENKILAAKAEEMVKMFDLINYAITNDKVIPFYQGIYNNELGKITKYEALMRIYNQEGKICPPGMFLEGAKKLKLYIPLSKIMLDKAMKDFEDKECELGLNISLSDIQSKEFKEWFLERLRNHSNPSKIIIEFVETENYNNNAELVEFLTSAREIGCKIAVDDFGVGFATYTSIVSLKPDIIKIDGDIIKNLIKNSENKIILDSICYMARLINSEVVAEFVEDEQIQEIVLNNNIDFSQGYYFAKPEPFGNLDI